MAEIQTTILHPNNTFPVIITHPLHHHLPFSPETKAPARVTISFPANFPIIRALFKLTTTVKGRADATDLLVCRKAQTRGWSIVVCGIATGTTSTTITFRYGMAERTIPNYSEGWCCEEMCPRLFILRPRL